MGGDKRKVQINDQHHHSSKMAAMTAILELVSINYLTNALAKQSDYL
jgi:hypothetical protein